MTQAQPRTFKFQNEDPDNFRVYYRRNETGGLFCFQWEGPKAGNVFYVCSRDGEPECEAKAAPVDAFDRYVLPSP